MQAQSQNPALRSPSSSLIFSGLFVCTLCIGFMFPRSLGYFPALLGLVTLIPVLIFKKADLKKKFAPIGICGAILALALASCFWSIDFNESIHRVSKLAPLMILGSALLYSLGCFDLREMKPFVTALPYIVILGLAWNVSELMSNGFLHKVLSGMAMNDPEYTPAAHNRSILLCLIFSPFAFYALRYGQWSMRLKYVLRTLIVVLALIILMLTESQTAHLSTGLALLGFFVLKPSNKMVRYSIMGLAAVLILTAPFVAQYIFKILPDMIVNIDWFREGYAPERLEIWDFISRYALQNPLYGFGIEATRAVPAFDTQMIYRPVATVLHPHNFALQLWIEFGVIGACAGAALICYLVGIIAKLPKGLGSSAMASFIVILTSLSTAYGIWQGWLIGAIFLAIAYTKILQHMSLEDERV